MCEKIKYKLISHLTYVVPRKTFLSNILNSTIYFIQGDNKLNEMVQMELPMFDFYYIFFHLMCYS